MGPLRVLHEGREIGAVVRLERSAQAPTLAASELAGGHAITRHVGLTDAELIARNLPHAFRSVDGPVTALLIVTPGGLDSYFAELHAAMRSNADPAEIRRIQDAYGIVRS